MLIITKNDLKGELYISAIGHTLRAGKSVTIDDSYANDPDVLWAVSKGLIEVQVDNNEKNSVSISDSDYISIKNTSNRLLNLSFLNKTLEPGRDFALSHDDFNSPEVSMMIEKGWVEPVIIEPEVKKQEDSSVSKKTASKKKTVSNSEMSDKEDKNQETESIDSFIDELGLDLNKEKTSINENNSLGMDSVTIAFPEADDDGIIFVDNNNEVD